MSATYSPSDFQGQTFGERVIEYHERLRTPEALPNAVQVLNPYANAQVLTLVRQFYTRFFSDQAPRVLLLGINPGRFGGGTTGIPFTSPVALRQYCDISNDLGTTHELSSRFVYTLVERMGGAAAFYARFYFGALYPLALIKNGKNYNFYDEAAVYQALRPAIVANIQAQIGFGANRQHAICLGQKNGEYLQRLNEQYRWFETIKVLDHPRYIMQYKLRSLDRYIEQYVTVLNDLTAE